MQVMAGQYQDPAALWRDIRQTYSSAKERGAAWKTNTDTRVLRDAQHDTNFVVRVAAALQDKPKRAKGDGEKPSSPFLPPDPDLTVGPLSDTHLLLLNKFNVVDHHTLVVTRRFQAQTEPLNEDDLAAAWLTMQAYPEGAVTYFNSGPESGASQAHKHLQVVPLPLAEWAAHPTPFWRHIESAWQAADTRSPAVAEMRRLPFKAFCCVLPERPSSHLMLQCYQALLGSMGLSAEQPSEVSYNLLLCRQYMMAVPRSQERQGPLALNALGYAGTILTRSSEDADWLESEQPMTVLAKAGVPWG